MTIVWFRLDLRLADNPALINAARRGDVVPVFIWAPDEEGDWPPGAASRWWLHQSLRALDASLRERGSRLIVRRGPSLDALRKLVRETGADAVFWNRRYEPALRERDAKVQQALIAGGLRVETFNSALLFEPWEIKTKSGGPYRVFTPFYRACLHSVGEHRVRPSAGMKIKGGARCAPLRSDPLPASKLTLDSSWEPGEAGARRQLAKFAKQAREYSTRRDRPDIDGTSRLSPHLHFGEVSPWKVWRAVPVESFRRQLVWREFAHHLLWHFPATTDAPLRSEFARLKWRRDAAALRKWQHGETGFAMVDAGMRELWATGWMHNRARMVAGSFLVKDLLLPWQEGARWFWDTLVDADLANNTLGWQWVAGCGVDAAPFFRIFNPTTQSEKFDPRGEYAQRWAAEPSKPIVNHEAARRRALAAFRELTR